MTTNEFAIWAGALKTYYPKENILPNAQAAELWFLQLQDIPFETAQGILNRWASLNKWSPSIAEIRELAKEADVSGVPEWGDAWREAIKAVNKYGSYQVQEALNSLSPLTRRVVEQLGFKELCTTDEDTISSYRANFRDIYTKLSAKAKEELMIPEQVKSMLTAIEERRKQ